MDFEENKLPKDTDPTPAPVEEPIPEESIPEEPEVAEADEAEGEPIPADPTVFTFGMPTRVPGGIPKVNNGFAIASLVTSILSIPCCCCSYAGIPILLGVAAIICAIFDRVKRGRFCGMSLAGLIVGIVGICLGIGMLILSLIAESLILQMVEDGQIPAEMIQQLVDQGFLAPEDVPEGLLPADTTTTFLPTTGGNA